MNIIDRAFSDMFKTSKRSASSVGDSYFGGSFFSFINGESNSVNYKQSLKLSAVYNAVDQISNDIAKLPFAVFERIDGNTKRLSGHQVDKLLSGSPNAYMTPFIFKKLMAISVLLRGNALAKIIFDGSGNPISLEFINWDKLVDIKKVKGQLVYYVQGENPLLNSEVLHFKGFTFNGIVGVSVITYACVQLGLALEVQQFSVTNYENKAVRQGVIETDKQIPNGKQQIVAGFKTAMAEKSPDRVVVLDDGLKFKPITITPKELEIIEQQRFSIEDIARWFNIAPHKIKSLQQSTNNNIEQQSLDHVSDTIQPYVTNWEQEFAMKLLTEKEKQTRFVKGNMNALLRSDIKSRAEYYYKASGGPWMTGNEVRELEDMNFLEGLDEPLRPANMQTMAQINDKMNNDE